MQRFLKLFATTALAVTLLAPLSANATGASFGGRVAAVVPCISPLGPSIWFAIVPASLYPVVYFIWTPATVTYLAGPVTHIGQQVLGIADVPFACKAGIVPFVGQRVQILGTSPTI